MTEPRLLLRSRLLVVAAGLVAAVVLVTCVIVSFTLHGSTGSASVGTFEAGDRFGMIGVGVLLGAGFACFARPRVLATDNGVEVRGVLAKVQLAWDQIDAVRFDDNSAWATLDLRDGDTVSLLALQRLDGSRTLAGVRRLRAALAAHQPGRGAGQAG